MNGTPVLSNMQQQSGLACYCQGSRTCRYVDSALGRFSGKMGNFFVGFDCAFRNSVSGRIVFSINQNLSHWINGSFFAYWFIGFFNLVMVPGGQPITEGTFLGMVLALGVIAPTGIQLICFAIFLFLLLWRRSIASSLNSGRVALRGSTVKSGIDNANNAGTWVLLPYQLLFPCLILLVFAAGATISSVVPRRSIMSFVLWCFYALIFAIGFDVAFRGEEDKVIWPLLTGVTFSGMVGIYQHLTGWQSRKAWLDAKFEDEIARVVGTFTNPTFFAEMIGLVLPLILALLIKNRSLRDKTLLLIYALIQGVALVLTWSRGAWLGFIASFAIMAVLFDKRLLLVGLAVALIGVTLAPPVFLDRFLSSFSLEDSSNSYRVFIWRGSLALLRDNLFRGIGLGAESFAQMYPEYMIIQTPAPHAHSTYLQMLIELGLCGFVVLMWLLFVCAWYSLSAIFTEKGHGVKKWVCIGTLSGVVAAVAGHMIQALIEHTWYNPQVTAVFWAWVGIAMGISLRPRPSRPEEAN